MSNFNSNNSNSSTTNSTIQVPLTLQNQQIKILNDSVKLLIRYLPKLLSQQSLTASIALAAVVDQCNELLKLIQDLKRQIVFRGIIVEGMEDRKSIFDKKVEEWSNEPKRDELEWKILEKGLGWNKSNNGT